MTDGNTARYRSNEPFSSRAVGPDGHSSDPLAELARLIGQSDPFAAAQAREQAAPVPIEPQHYDEPAPQPELPLTEARDPYRESDLHAHDRGAYDDRGGYDPLHDAVAAALASNSNPAQQPEWFNPSPPPPPANFDPFAPPSPRAMSPDPSEHPLRTPSDPPAAFLAEFKIPAMPTPGATRDELAADGLHPSDLREAGDFQPMPRTSLSAGSMPPFLTDSAPLPPSAEEYYDDAPQGGRRKGLLTVAAVLCLAVVGTAGAFGYRTWMSGSGNTAAKAPPPVIRANAEPSKVAPPPGADPAANKISYDRFADRGQNEKVVPREEKPVDIKTAPARPSAPAAASNIFPTPPAASTAAPAAGNPPSVLTEPKRVRTVPIRPDAAETSARAQIASPAPTAPTLPMPTTRQAAVAAAPAAANIATQAVAAPPQQPQVRAPATRPATQPTSGNAPLSLSPDANPPPPAAAQPRPPAPTRVAAAPAAAAGGNGNYLVQVSSQRSETDAQNAYRSLQSRYSSVLGDRQAVIRRADLAGKGTYYRAMVGPFTTRDQAVQLCSSLKAAGGDCVVQAN